MKKKLESELISIAHRILKLTGREDLEKMHSEIALLYQKITVLKFIENNHVGETSDFVGMDTSFFNALEGAFNNTVTDSVEVADKTFVNIDVEEEEAIMEPAIEKIKDMEDFYFTNKKPVLLLVDKKKSYDKFFKGDFA